jgi:serine/threonine protein kinase/pimeloyl-ACP methyl ester carboxylesterase
MTPERWHTVERLYHAALEREPADRAAFLNGICADEQLRREVESLLGYEELGSYLLQQRPWQPGATPTTATLAGSHRRQTPIGTESLLGRQFGPYRILCALGAGGMGEVYRAHDSKLDRDVAIKTLPWEFERDSQRLARFRREARTLASLNHPNIAAIYGLEKSGDVDCLVLELVEGETLHGPLPIERALEYAHQIAEGLEAAHEKGIIHRDLKPANIKVTPQGRVKVLDFGLAKAIWAPERNQDVSQTQPTRSAETLSGHILGTPGYMSPEQMRGQGVDERTDIWAFGCLLYELLTGKRAFPGESSLEAAIAVLDCEPDWQTLPPKIPAKIRDLLRRCLQKDPNRRLPHIADAHRVIEEELRGRDRWRLLGSQARQPRFAIPAAVVLGLLGLGSVLLYEHNSRVYWVREQAIPEITKLFDSAERKAAFHLLLRAEKVLPNDPTLKKIQEDNSFPMSFNTNPPGAEVWVADYDAQDNEWLRLGRTPFTIKKLPPDYYRFRVEKPGFQTILGAGEVPGPPIEFQLDTVGSIPADMVRVPAGSASIPGLQPVKLGTFLIDRYEITNRQFKQFIDAGGYQKQEYWKEDFIHGGRTLSREQALQLFRDSTGFPGPSTWKFGNYPRTQDDYPVSGVSWYEAAAYAEFAGKQLPTIYHWQRAASPGFFSDVAQLSNFNAIGPTRVGAYKGLGAFGTLDMAGNVKEWCWNKIGGQRYIRGGAWNEPAYMFSVLDARDPWDRSPQNGIRCVRYDVQADPGVRAALTRPVRDYSKEKPARDEAFRLYQGLYSYDPVDLDSRVEGVDEENSYWKREKVSFAAAYGNERVGGYFYIPKQAKPPYQTVIYAASSLALWLPSLGHLEEHFFDFIIKSGRAFLVPVVKGHYQRQYAAPPAGANEARDRLIVESKDFRRSIDYLMSRPDVDHERLGVYSMSRGVLVPILAIGEHRLKAAVLLSSGLGFDRPLPAADPFNFLRRFRVPTLMIAGRLDFLSPVETSVRPMFRLLGTPEKDKELVLSDGGHGLPNAERKETIRKETLDWYDRYLGSVK